MTKKANTKPLSKGWPKKCHACGAGPEHIGFDYAYGFNCSKCGGCDSDE